MNRDAWWIFVALALTGAATWFGVTGWQSRTGWASARADLEATRAASTAQVARLAEAWAEVQSARDRAAELATAVVEASAAGKKLEQEMRAAVQSRDVVISELQGKLTLSILDRILFDSGEATLKPEGMQVLDQIARVLTHYTNRHVQVIGHTDNLPIRIRYASNWELSAARAIAAVRYLTEKAGVDPRLLSAVGSGEFQPIADNATAEGRARNRRIALVVLPETFAGGDTKPVPAPVVGQEGGPSVPAEGSNDPAQASPAIPLPAPPSAAGRDVSAEDTVAPVPQTQVPPE